MADKSGIQWTDATKRCSQCCTDKPRSAFANDSSRPDGLTYLCKSCRNAKVRARYTPKSRPGPRGWQTATRDGDRRQARRRINYLVEQGRIPKAADMPCFDCGDAVFTDNPRHEYDHARGYDGDNQLYVEPVCQRCHRNREEARRVG